MDNNVLSKEIDTTSASMLHAACSDIGMRREENQDSYGIILNDTFSIFVVADGMGGVKGGATASRLAIGTMESFFTNKNNFDIKELKIVIKDINQKINLLAKQDPSLNGMGTTIVGLVFSKDKSYVFHVGDSRAYVINDEATLQLTEDHTLVTELVKTGAITAKQAANHPVSHMLTRSLGPSEEVEMEVADINNSFYENGTFLLCSDGLYNLVSDDEIREILSSRTLEEASQELVNLANLRGGTDNITVILIRSSNKELSLNVPPKVELNDIKSTEIINTKEFIYFEDQKTNLNPPKEDNIYNLNFEESKITSLNNKNPSKSNICFDNKHKCLLALGVVSILGTLITLSGVNNHSEKEINKIQEKDINKNRVDEKGPVLAGSQELQESQEKEIIEPRVTPKADEPKKAKESEPLISLSVPPQDISASDSLRVQDGEQENSEKQGKQEEHENNKPEGLSQDQQALAKDIHADFHKAEDKSDNNLENIEGSKQESSIDISSTATPQEIQKVEPVKELTLNKETTKKQKARKKTLTKYYSKLENNNHVNSIYKNLAQENLEINKLYEQFLELTFLYSEVVDELLKKDNKDDNLESKRQGILSKRNIVLKKLNAVSLKYLEQKINNLAE